MTWMVRCLVVLTCSILTTPAAGQPVAASNRVDLRFGWKPGIEISVTAIRTRTRSAEQNVSRTSTSRYTLRVDADGENLRIRFTDPEFIAGDAPASAPSQDQSRIMERLADLMPDFLVSPDGEFVGIHDLPGFQVKFRAFLAEVMPPDVDARFVEQMQSLLTNDEFLNARASEEWNTIVGAWVGSSFEVGVPAEFVRVEPIEVFSGNEIRMNYAFAAGAEFACRRGNVERRCTHLAMRSMADPEDTKRMIDELRAKLLPEEAYSVPDFNSLEIDNKLRVTTEPDGLIPHAYSLTKIIRGTLATPDGDLPFEQIDATEVRYVYR